MGTDQRQVTEQLVPADRHAGKVERVELDLNDSHKHFAIRSPVIAPDRHLRSTPQTDTSSHSLTSRFHHTAETLAQTVNYRIGHRKYCVSKVGATDSVAVEDLGTKRSP